MKTLSSTHKTSFWSRVSTAFNVLRGKEVSSFLENKISWDPVEEKLIFHGDVEIRSTGTLVISSQEDIIIESGNREGEYTHSIWLNSELEGEYANGEYISEHGEDLCQRRSSGECDLQSGVRPQIPSTLGDHGEDGCGSCQSN